MASRFDGSSRQGGGVGVALRAEAEVMDAAMLEDHGERYVQRGAQLDAAVSRAGALSIIVV
jgi:hypothetical protein